MSKLLGVVMSGGESKRMGTDKGLKPIMGSYWAVHVTNKLVDIDLPVVISINVTQYEKYQLVFPGHELIVDDTDISGPLNGLLSVHKIYPQNDLLLLACDMIDMNISTLQNLVNVYQAEPGFDFYAYHHGDFAEPLCALYTCSGLQKVMEQFNMGLLHDVSFQHVLNQGLTKKLEVLDAGSFNNFNK